LFLIPQQAIIGDKIILGSMFDIGFWEICVVLVVAAGVLEREDVVQIIKGLKRLRNGVHNYVQEQLALYEENEGDEVKDPNLLKELNEAKEDIEGYMRDMEGKWRKTYQLPEIDKETNKHATKRQNLEEPEKE
jgi:Sec-independent protein translocase protein TatA